MRNAQKVILAVMDVVPESETKLLVRLQRIAEDVFFQPPESSKPWVDLEECLDDMIERPTVPRRRPLPWHYQIVSIVRCHPE